MNECDRKENFVQAQKRQRYDRPTSREYTTKICYNCKTCSSHVLCPEDSQDAHQHHFLSSHVAALRPCLCLQFVPHAHHLPRRLVVCGMIIFYASELAELEAVHILDRFRAVESFYPHSHAYILHLEQLQEVTHHFSGCSFSDRE